MPKRKIVINEKYKKPIHSKATFLLCLISSFFMGYLGFSYIDEQFGILCLIEMGMCLFGLMATIFMRENDMFEFRDFDIRSVYYGSIIFAIIMVVQILFQIPLTARTPEIALAIVFCSISEEVFFRGFLIGMTIKFSKNVDKNNPILKYLIIAAGIMLSSIFFTLIHINYYDNIALLATIFVCGLVLAIAYLISDDLMAVIIGHFILNAIVSFQLLTQILIGG